MFERYQRSEQALMLAIIEMVINSVSTELTPYSLAPGTAKILEEGFEDIISVLIKYFDMQEY